MSGAGQQGGAPRVFVGLGSNLGDRERHLRESIGAMEAAGLPVLAVSPVYESQAHTPDEEPQPPYLNAVVEVAPVAPPQILLELLQAIERAAGRERPARWAPRTLDLDLLLHGKRIIVTPRLSVPHPRLAERRFVLQPLADLANEVVVPGVGLTVWDLLARCTDYAPLRRTAYNIARR